MWTIRPIRPDDAPRLEAGLKRLSPETQRRRFLAAKPRLSKSELNYLTEIDGHDHLALVATDHDGDIVAVARAIRLKDAPDTAEFAIVVADPLQGHGLGTELVWELAEQAREHGIAKFAGTMLPDNEAARRLMAHVAATFEEDRIQDGLRQVVITL